jgi:hypothetical protein
MTRHKGSPFELRTQTNINFSDIIYYHGNQVGRVGGGVGVCLWDDHLHPSCLQQHSVIHLIIMGSFPETNAMKWMDGL